MKLIAKEIEKLSPDLVMLQEVISHADRNLLFNELHKYGWVFYSGKNGLLESGGLVMMSKKLDLKNLQFHKFVEQGPKHLISVPDKILGKGFQTIICKYANKEILIINAHLLCTYAKTPDDLQSQRKQFEQLVDFINSQKHKDIILAGDLNSDPDSKDILYLKDKCKLKDTLDIDTYTVDPKNLNRGWLMNFFSDGKSYRTDYVLISGNIQSNTTEVTFTKPQIVNSKNIHLSDHYAVLANLEI